MTPYCFTLVAMDELISAEEAQELLYPQRAKKLAACIQGGWDKWRELGRRAPDLQIPLNASTRALIVHNHITDLARKEFADDPAVHVGDNRGFLILTIEEKMVVRFKKYRNKSFKTSNIPTRQQLQFAYQLQLPGMPPEATRLVAGYLLDELQTSIETIAVTCSIGPDLQWMLDISDEADAGEDVLEPAGRPDEPRGPRVGPKSAERRENETGQR